MKKNILFLISILVIVTFSMSGCNSTQTGNLTRTFIGGTDGFDISFVESAPPYEVYEMSNEMASNFDVALRLENKGEWPIESTNDVLVSITGIDYRNDFGISTNSKNIEELMPGKKRDNDGTILQGGITFVEFRNLAYQKSVSGPIPFSLRGNVCYEYGTKAVSKICIRQDILGARETTTKTCEVNENKPVENSAAPVQITSLSEQASGANSVSFIFEIAHKGVGSVFMPDSTCGSVDELRLKDKIKVMVRTNIGAIDDLKCTGLDSPVSEAGSYSGIATLYERGTRQIRCTQTVYEKGDYEKPIDIELEYGYKQSIKADFIVKPLR